MRRCARAIKLSVVIGAFAASIIPLYANTARMGPEVFRSGSDIAARQTLYLEVFINGVSTNLIGEFDASPTGFYATPNELMELGLALDNAPVNAAGKVRLDSINGLSYSFDPQTQVLRLFVSDQMRIPQIFDAARSSLRGTGEPKSDFGAVLNYTLFGNLQGEVETDLPDYAGLAGTFDTRIFSDYGIFGNAFVAKIRPGGDEPELVRLDSTWSYEDPDKMVTYKAGDLISSGLSWTRPVRLAGFQASRNFGLRSDLITTPISTIAGTAAVPSTVDVYVNSSRAYSNRVDSGPFQVVNVPVVSGPSTVRVVVRDTLGRETVSAASYYVSPRLLAQGLVDFSIEAGYPRRSYGLESDDYSGDLFASGSVRYGLSDWLTLEGHTEIGADLLNGGAGASFGLGSVGAASLSLAGSDYQPSDCSDAYGGCARRTGLQLGGSVELAIRDWRIYARTLRTFGDYADIASVTATDPFDHFDPYPYNYVPAKIVDQLSVSIPLGFDQSFLNTSFTHTVNALDERHRIVGLSYSRPAFAYGTFSLSAYQDLDYRDNVGVFAGISFAIADDLFASTGVAGGSGDLALSADIVRPETSEIGSYGWRVRTVEGRSAHRSAAVSYRTAAARLEAGVRDDAGRSQMNVQADGAVALLNGDVFLTNRIDDAFAVVETGAPNVEVFHENRPVGVTDDGGRLLVPSLRSWQPNRLSIDPTNLPVNADIKETKSVVKPAGRSGVVVKFETEAKTDTALVSFQGADGALLPVGSEGSLDGGSELFLIGYGGQAYIRGLSAQNAATITLPDGTRCSASFSFAPQSDDQVRIDNVECL